MALVELLQSLGCGASGFASAEDYTAGAGQGSCNCGISDIEMPGMSRVDLRELLAARGSATPVIMIAAGLGAGLEANAEASRVVYLLRKPFETTAAIDCPDQASKH